MGTRTTIPPMHDAPGPDDPAETTDDATHDESVEREAADRSRGLRRLVVGAAFAVPVVSSFSLDGMGVSPTQAAAGTTTASPWRYQGVSRRDPGGFGAFGGHTGGRIIQETALHGSFLAAGATGLHFRCRATGTLSIRIVITGLIDETFPGPAGDVEHDIWFPSATSEPLGVAVLISGGGPAGFGSVDDVSVQGWFP